MTATERIRVVLLRSLRYEINTAAPDGIAAGMDRSPRLRRLRQPGIRPLRRDPNPLQTLRETHMLVQTFRPGSVSGEQVSEDSNHLRDGHAPPMPDRALVSELQALPIIVVIGILDPSFSAIQATIRCSGGYGPCPRHMIKMSLSRPRKSRGAALD